MKTKCKFTAKRPFFIGYIMLCCICLLLTLGRWYSIFDADFVVITWEIHSHLSNLVLSMLFYLAAGYAWLLIGVKFHIVAFLGVFIIVSNFICETIMGFMNTPDIMDAIYGAVGTIIVFLFLWLTSKYGLVPAPAESVEP